MLCNSKGQFEIGSIPWNKGVPNLALTERNRSSKLFGKLNPFYGKKHSQETKQKMSEANRGEKAPNWKGGITNANKLERTRFRETMQKIIFERDNYKCQICEATGDLQVDHIQSWSEFKELRFDPNNCRTLCAKCHYKLTFGREMPKETKVWGHNLGRRVIK